MNAIAHVPVTAWMIGFLIATRIGLVLQSGSDESPSRVSEIMSEMESLEPMVEYDPSLRLLYEALAAERERLEYEAHVETFGVPPRASH